MCIAASSPLPEYVSTLIEVTAARMKGWYRFTESDLNDIEQTITHEVVRRRAKFDPTKAKEQTYLAHLVKHAKADIIEKRKASNRDYRREESSLDQWVFDEMGGWVRRGEAIPEEEARRHLGTSPLSQEQIRDLAIDLKTVLAALSPRLRRLCRHLMQYGSIQEVAKKAGLHRSTVYEAIHQIRRAFGRAGLEQYLTPRVPPRQFGNHAGK